MTKTPIFLPPGSQRRLAEILGVCPRLASATVALKIDSLWQQRNAAPEQRLDAIDRRMEQLVIDDVRRSDYIIHRLNLDGTGHRPYRLYFLPRHNSATPDRWAEITNVPCPLCDGRLQWAEAGYVPGYRICDHCHRHFMITLSDSLRCSRGTWLALLTRRG